MADKTPSLLSRYEDPTGEFPNQSLAAATWYAKHHAGLRVILIWTLIVWTALTLGISLYIFGKYIIFDYPQDQENIQSLSYSYISPSVIEHFSPQQLVFSNTEVFAGIEKRYDFFSEVSNPNTSFIAVVNYRFSVSGGATEERQAIVLPLQKRPLTFFGYQSDSSPGQVQLEVSSVTWKRIDPHTIPDPHGYIDQRLAISVNDFSYLAPNQSLGITTPGVQFSVTNNSLFSYWEFPCIVEIMHNNTVVGILPLVITQFKEGETRIITQGIFASGVLVDSVVVTPLVNVFDPGVFLSN